jgi:chemotaxis protein CheD
MVGINEVDVTDQQVEYICFGLGSCVGLFITDRLSTLVGAAHIPLGSGEPDNNGEFYGADRLIDQLLDRFEQNGSDLSCLRAKIAGGAKVVESTLSIGEENIRSVINRLVERRVFIAAVDVGGNVSRTARFNSKTGELLVSTSEQKSYFI